ncbi:hypothetical protein CMUS01_11153 [Colletotrichum musicola]|uniref:Uncharacterized protein n=1 Tax=Colletotrichum musicola TaxID=2175873 RepID=A0A8H6N6Q6_9PEZI|nr:hypothetical protein CMUS01_11153 [Colletotrichum musicola]
MAGRRCQGRPTKRGRRQKSSRPSKANVHRRQCFCFSSGWPSSRWVLFLTVLSLCSVPVFERGGGISAGGGEESNGPSPVAEPRYKGRKRERLPQEWQRQRGLSLHKWTRHPLGTSDAASLPIFAGAIPGETDRPEARSRAFCACVCLYLYLHLYLCHFVRAGTTKEGANDFKNLDIDGFSATGNIDAWLKVPARLFPFPAGQL